MWSTDPFSNIIKPHSLLSSNLVWVSLFSHSTKVLISLMKFSQCKYLNHVHPLNPFSLYRTTTKGSTQATVKKCTVAHITSTRTKRDASPWLHLRLTRSREHVAEKFIRKYFMWMRTGSIYKNWFYSQHDWILMPDPGFFLELRRHPASLPWRHSRVSTRTLFSSI